MRRAQYGLEFHAPVQVEGVDRVHESEDSSRHQVVQLHLVGKLDVNPLGVVADEMEIVLHQGVPQFFRFGFLEIEPDLSDVP